MAQPKLPLRGRTVLLACSESKTDALAGPLGELGAAVVAFPVISIRPVEDRRALDSALDRLESYSWIIFTSVHGVRYFLEGIRERGIPADRARAPRVCAVGPATAGALKTAGIAVSLVPKEHLAEGILRALADLEGGLETLAGRRILLPRAREARDLLPSVLVKAGALVDDVPCYQNVRPEADPERVRALLADMPDLTVFTSSSAVIGLVAALGEEAGRTLLGRTAVAALGPITARTVASFGKKPEIVPRESTILALVQSIRDFYLQSGPDS